MRTSVFLRSMIHECTFKSLNTFLINGELQNFTFSSVDSETVVLLGLKIFLSKLCLSVSISGCRSVASAITKLFKRAAGSCEEIVMVYGIMGVNWGLAL